MQSEFDALRQWPHDRRVRVTVSGARPQLAEDGARWLVAEGCSQLLSFGVCGGLDPKLAPGSLLAPSAVMLPDGGEMTLSPIAEGMACRISGSERMEVSARAKARLFTETGAAAVDMETHRVALVGSEAGIPVTAIRVVGDHAGTNLPSFVEGALTETGHPRILPVLAGLLRQPGQLGALLRLKRETDIALKELSRVVLDGAITRLIEDA